MAKAKTTTITVLVEGPRTTRGPWQADLVAGQVIEVPARIAAELIETGVAVETKE